MSKDAISEPFIRKLKARIEADPNLTPAGLSVKAGLGNSAIRLMFAKGTSPRVETMRKICKALGTTLEEFLSEAQTSEEKEIMGLLMQLDEASRRELLGYGRALAARLDQDNRQSPEEQQSTPDRS